jgi:hypothetical protein
MRSLILSTVRLLKTLEVVVPKLWKIRKWTNWRLCTLAEDQPSKTADLYEHTHSYRKGGSRFQIDLVVMSEVIFGFSALLSHDPATRDELKLNIASLYDKSGLEAVL